MTACRDCRFVEYEDIERVVGKTEQVAACQAGVWDNALREKMGWTLDHPADQCYAALTVRHNRPPVRELGRGCKEFAEKTGSSKDV